MYLTDTHAPSEVDFEKLKARGIELTRQILMAEKQGHLFLVNALLKEKDLVNKQIVVARAK